MSPAIGAASDDCSSPSFRTCGRLSALIE